MGNIISFVPTTEKGAMKVHFIAIGGSIMHSLAIALHEAGHQVSGSDDQIYDPARSKLAKHGILPAEEGWHPERISSDLDAVILGMHAFEDNPELAKAQELGLNIMSFPEFVYQQSLQKQRIIIAGSYGKTTITSMIMHVLKGVGKKFNYLVGATVPGFDNSVRLEEDAPIIIIEGDEYLTSRIDPRPKFLLYQAHMVLLSGISWDHINVFPTEAEYEAQFANLLKASPKAANIIYDKNDKRLSKLVDAHTDTDTHYLYPYKTPKYKVKNGVYTLKLEDQSAPISVIGKHNMTNIAGAWEVCKLLAVGVEDFLKHIGTFVGAGLRLETVGEGSRGLVIKDYAHAPAKVKATVEAVKERYPKKRLISVVELHTFSSLNKAFLPHYKKSLSDADVRIVMVDPQAIEKRRMEPISEEDLKAGFAHKDLICVQDAAGLESALASVRQGENDVILMMSSGKFGGLELESLV